MARPLIYNVDVPSLEIRVFGDPVLRQVAKPVTEIDGKLSRLVDTMVETMYEAPGVGLAANQIGIQKSLFVYDIGDGPQTVINPVIKESSGEWTYEEGCLSVPGLHWPIVRPNQVYLVGLDLDGNEISFEADEYLGRVFQHEVDHLNGVLLLEHLDTDQRKEAMKILRERVSGTSLDQAESSNPVALHSPGTAGL